MPVLALAEIYYWVDDQGIQNYTSRFESIPESYRSGAQTLSLPTSPAPPELQPERIATGAHEGSLYTGVPGDGERQD